MLAYNPKIRRLLSKVIHLATFAALEPSGNGQLDAIGYASDESACDFWDSKECGFHFLSQICIHFWDMSDLKDLILSRISSGTPSSVWTVNDLLDCGSYDAVRKALQRLASAKDIRRIDDGLYDKPQLNRLTGQSNPPDPRQVIDAVARRNQIRVLVDGMTAANDLGLTNAVPAKIVVHTDARLRPIHLGKLTISFKPTAASKLYWAGRPAMRLVQALHWLRDTTDLPTLSAQVRALLRRLPQADQVRADLADGMPTLPAWMQDLLRPIVNPEAQA
ncbi:MAG: DUF6088 family protein [Pseudomonadota bacterium]|nr:DUF6088 family protein [Pseudomonadota bacterium]